MIVNDCVLYNYLLIRKGRKPLIHYEFQHQFALERLGPADYDLRESVVEKRVMKRKSQRISNQSEKEVAARMKAAPIKSNGAVAEVSRKSWTLVGIIKSRMNFYSQHDRFATA